MENKNWSIQSVISDYLKEKFSQKHDSDHWYASDMGYCFRKRCYKRAEVKPSEEMTDQQMRKLECGNIFHWWIQKKLEDCGVLLKKEQEVENKEYNYKGHYDALVEKDGVKLMYDFKTVHSYAFHYLRENGGQGKEPHKLQLASYMLFSGEPVSSGRVLYISKDDLCVEEISVELEDYKDKIIAELKKLNDFWDKKKLPPKLKDIEDNKPNWQCRFCSYLTYCRGKDWPAKPKKLGQLKTISKKSSNPSKN